MSDIDAILDSGNLEDIDAILTAIEQGADEDQAVTLAAERGDTGSDPAAQPTQSTQQTDEPAAPVDEPSEPVVLAKDGKHTIPFSELEGARRRASEVERQLADLKRENDLLAQQLTDANIAPKQLPEKIRFTPEQLAELESYGEIGQAVAVLAQQNAALMEQLGSRSADPQPPAEEPPNPFAKNADTLRWAQDDTQWAIVESVNAALNADPNWTGKSLDQRVPEIVRRTKLALGEATDQSLDRAADAALQRAARAAPNSLTDVGGEVPGSLKTTAERLADAEMGDVEAILSQQLAKGISMDDAIAALL